MEGIISAWGKILTGYQPNLSIEITRECPLTCPGCYAYGGDHLGGDVTLRELNEILPRMARMGIYTQLVTSAVRQIPLEWAKLRRLGARELIVVGFIAAIGFSVGLFFCAALFPPGQLRAEISMGVLLSLAAAPLALISARVLRVGRFAHRHAAGVEIPSGQ